MGAEEGALLLSFCSEWQAKTKQSPASLFGLPGKVWTAILPCMMSMHTWAVFLKMAPV